MSSLSIKTSKGVIKKTISDVKRTRLSGDKVLASKPKVPGLRLATFEDMP
ncbi:hypothetical protein AVEN_132664-1, partial [Araneus ventricosus]